MGTVLVGLDGATWRTLLRLAERSQMPFLASLLDKPSTAYGTLVSTDPPITGAAWLALATGLNPGKTGVLDFFARDSVDSFELRFVNSADFMGRAYWDILGLYGFESAVIFYPTLYPPYPLRGCIVSGFGAPSDRLYSYPEGLGAELERAAGVEFKPVIEPKRPEYRDIEVFIKDVHKHIDGLERIAKYIFERCRTVKNLTFVVSVTDWIQHRAWHVIEEHPLADKLGEQGYRSRIEELYTRIDSLLRLFHEYSESSGSYFVVVSDHGFQYHLGVFNLFRWLERGGYLVRRKSSLLPALISIAKDAVKRLGLARFLRRTLPEKLVEAAKVTNIDIIDVDRSLFVVLEHSMQFGAVYINPKLAEQVGGRDAAKRLLVRTLEDAAKMFNLRIAVHFREEMYRGDKLELLPDAVIEVNNYSCAVSNTPRYPIYLSDVLHPQYTGIHDKNGIILLHGDGVKHAKNFTSTIYNVMPTLLYIHDVPIPREVDGEPLEELLGLNRRPRWEGGGERVRRMLSARARLAVRKGAPGGQIE